MTPELVAAVRAEISRGERAWNAPQIAQWLVERHALRVSADRLGRLLRRFGFSYQRTRRSLRHKQDPAQVARKAADLHTLEKGAMPG